MCSRLIGRYFRTKKKRIMWWLHIEECGMLHMSTLFIVRLPAIIGQGAPTESLSQLKLIAFNNFSVIFWGIFYHNAAIFIDVINSYWHTLGNRWNILLICITWKYILCHKKRKPASFFSFFIITCWLFFFFFEIFFLFFSFVDWSY